MVAALLGSCRRLQRPPSPEAEPAAPAVVPAAVPKLPPPPPPKLGDMCFKGRGWEKNGSHSYANDAVCRFVERCSCLSFSSRQKVAVRAGELIVRVDELSSAEKKSGCITLVGESNNQCQCGQGYMHPFFWQTGIECILDVSKELAALPTLRHVELAGALAGIEAWGEFRQQVMQKYQALHRALQKNIESARVAGETLKDEPIDTSAFDVSRLATVDKPLPTIQLVCGGSAGAAAAALDAEEVTTVRCRSMVVPQFIAASAILTTGYLRGFREQEEVKMPFAGSAATAQKMIDFLAKPSQPIEFDSDEEAFKLHQFATQNQMERIVAQAQYRAVRHVLEGAFQPRLAILSPDAFADRLEDPTYYVAVLRSAAGTIETFYRDNLKQLLPAIAAPDAGAAAAAGTE